MRDHFKDYNDMAKRIDDAALEVTKDSVLVLQSAGPQGAPGLPEWGQLPIPKKLGSNAGISTPSWPRRCGGYWTRESG